MKEVILKIENLSKQYRLGTVGTGTIGHDLNRWWHRVRGKEDPFLKIGETNDRSTKGNSEYVWALKDINFEVKRGEVLGIIGKNGAGKSTLLKILSKVTGPTTGSIKSKGRIASLLEVGTGFHPEMTGRENVFLNGAILGMTKKEINNKLEEIIEFSGCQRYIDTPVKRYSSGMRVRLAFAVAAFLEPDILVIDEVLAVGDVEFQKKAIGKMQDISKGEGRTVLFVSHNMASVKKLCTRGILLQNGKIAFEGVIDEVISFYLEEANKLLSSTGVFKSTITTQNEFNLDQVELLNDKSETRSFFSSSEAIHLKIKYNITSKLTNMRVNVKVFDANQVLVFTTTTHDVEPVNKHEGDYICKTNFPKNFFNKGKYFIDIQAGIPNVEELYKSTRVLSFEIEKMTSSGSRMNEFFPGVTAPNIIWNVEKIDDAS